VSSNSFCEHVQRGVMAKRGEITRFDAKRTYDVRSYFKPTHTTGNILDRE
jgi:hypothetical protein